jgi:hypothetical protein
MPILVDTRMVPSVDATFQFLTDVALHSQSLGHEVLFHPRVRDTSLHAAALTRATYAAQSPKFDGSELDDRSLEALVAAYVLWDEAHTRDDVVAALAREVGLLRANEITGVIVWGSAHPLSLTLQVAAGLVRVPSLVMERGLVPDSWTLFETAQWMDSPTRRHDFEQPPVEAIREDARRSLLTPFGGKYSEPLDGETDHGTQGPEILFASGFPLALGHSDEQDQVEADDIWARLVANGARHGFTPMWRGHPAAGYRPSPAPSENQLAASIPSALTHASALICQGTNTWAYGVLWDVPTLVVGMPSARDAQITPSDLPLGDGPSILAHATHRWASGLRDELEDILNDELCRTHFYWMSPGYRVPGAREFSHHALTMMGITPMPAPTESVWLEDAYRERIRELLREARIVAGQYREHEDAYAGLTWELEHTQQQLIRASAAMEAAIAQEEAATTALAAVTNSLFWRATRPIRELLALVKRKH